MACRWLWVAAVVLAMGIASAADTVVSFLGHEGPVAEPGATPSVLGWGPDDQTYPEQFAVNPVDGAEMVWVPAGTFDMGSTQEELDEQWQENGWEPAYQGGATDEKPQHGVTISQGFWLYRHEVTNGQYAQFLAATGHAPHALWDEYKAHTKLPVNNVTWDDCTAYAAWTKGALPTEAQWEWSVRGPEGRMYPWGNRWDRTKCLCAEYLASKALPNYDEWLAWLQGVVGDDLRFETPEIVGYLREVGSFPESASWCGGLDLAGSMWEWCSDWHGEGYYGQSPAADPAGPISGTYRVLRGGCWHDIAYDCRSAYRNYDDAEYGNGDTNGFRVARAL